MTQTEEKPIVKTEGEEDPVAPTEADLTNEKLVAQIEVG